ncbi:MAG: ParB/Srx family N-terminal domain-containing protein [Phycisphaerae bacterium]|nr:ParB/Srx family N-terminal domain-containing protein [Phycisphaerae bacterium]
MAANKKPSGASDAATSSLTPYERFPVGDLLFDDRNPRLVEFAVATHPTQFDLLKALYQQMAAEELAMSIAYNGYFNHEPLIIERRHDGKYTVIEGNRRLAAVQLLLSADLRRRLKATDLPDIDAIDPKRRTELATLPAIVSTRKDVWRYLGFKHVNGPATWGAYAKAQYVAQVHNDYHIPLEVIAQQIGDYSNTVERQYRGLMVIEQAEDEGVFSRGNTYKNKFYFNYIYTALDNATFREFLGVDRKARSERKPVPAAKRENLRDLCLWLYGNDQKQIEPLIRSQNPDLRILGETISQSSGVKALRNGAPLKVAHDVSLGDEQLFRTALREGKEALQRAHATLTTGYEPGDRDLIDQARDIERLANDLVDGMVKKQGRQTRPKRAQRTGRGVN